MKTWQNDSGTDLGDFSQGTARVKAESGQLFY